MPQLPGGSFDPSQFNDMRDFSPVYPGDYIAKVMASEFKDTSTGGQMLVLTFDIVAGDFKGKQFTSRLNLINSNPKAVKIANEELATLSRACGIQGPLTTSEQLHGIPIVLSLKLEPGDGQYGPSNSATGYKTAAGLTEAPANPPPSQTTLDIIAGVQASPEAAPAATSVPSAPDGFAAPPPPAETAAVPPPAEPAAPAVPAPTPAPADVPATAPAGDPAPAAPTPAAPATAEGGPPW